MRDGISDIAESRNGIWEKGKESNEWKNSGKEAVLT
jgi:hypothetical protein